MTLNLRFGGELDIPVESDGVIEYSDSDSSVLAIIDFICRLQSDVLIISEDSNIQEIISQYSTRSQTLSDSHISFTHINPDSIEEDIVICFSPRFDVEADYVVYAHTETDTTDIDYMNMDSVVSIVPEEARVNEEYKSVIKHTKNLYGRLKPTRRVEYQDTIYIDTTQKQ